MTVRVSVPGKVHLMGEHAVVYGKPAILAAINLRLWAEVTTGKNDSSEITIDTTEDEAYLRSICGLVFRHYQMSETPHCHIKIKSDIPVGYHLGSSAAVAAATVGAVTYALKRVWNPAAINQLSYEAEKLKHGNPSGGDNTAVVFGGFIWYRKELEFLRTLWQLPLKINKSLNSFILVDTGRPQETTGEMVAYVNSKFKIQSSKFMKLFDRNEEATKMVTIALKQNQPDVLIAGISAGERTLEAMGVVSPRVRKLVRNLEKTGAAAKILGGGGRKDGTGYLLVFHRDKKKLIDYLGKTRVSYREITLGEEGIRLEQKE